MSDHLVSCDDVVQNILRQRRLGPYVVAVEGRGGAGKSTFANALVMQLSDSAVIPIDDFLRKEHITDPKVEDHYDISRVIREVLIPFRQGLAVNYRRLDWNTDSLVPIDGIIDTTLIVLEGMCAYATALDDYVDMRVWVETPADVATARGRIRDSGNPNELLWDLWQRQDDDYISRLCPRDRADFVVSGV